MLRSAMRRARPVATVVMRDGGGRAALPGLVRAPGSGKKGGKRDRGHQQQQQRRAGDDAVSNRRNRQDSECASQGTLALGGVPKAGFANQVSVLSDLELAGVEGVDENERRDVNTRAPLTQSSVCSCTCLHVDARRKL